MSGVSASAAISVPMSGTSQSRTEREPSPPRQPHAAGQWQDWLFERTTMFFALFVLLTLAAIILALGYTAQPAFEKFGFGFLVSDVWNPVTSDFGALAPIYGTLVTSAIALLIGVPVSFGIALFLTEMCPASLKRPLGTAVELLAAIPSIIYGMWGLFIFAPLFGDYIQPALKSMFGDLWILGPLFQGAPNGIGMLSAGIILSVMIIPFIASVMRDVFEIVPPVLKESAYGIGATTWEVVWNVVPPVYEGRRDRRHHARPGARPRRNDGGDLRHRQCLQDQRVAVRARQFDRLVAGERVQRGRRPGASGLADRAGPRALRADADRPHALAAPDRPAREGRGQEDLMGMRAMNNLYRKRLFVNRFNLVMSLATMGFGMFFLLWILGVLFLKGFEALSPTLFTQMTPPPGSAGGLMNAIFGSVVIVLVATFISTPIGILAGIYLAEFGKNGWIARSTRFINDILLSAPSIVIGLFVYTVYVARVGHFSGWAGSFALALIAIPVVVRTTENMLLLVPSSLREAAVALGAPMWKVIMMVTLKAVRGGVDHRDPARDRPGLRRDRAAPVHRAQQPVLEQRHERADGESAGGHLPVRAEPVRRLEDAGVGRCAAHHADGPGC